MGQPRQGQRRARAIPQPRRGAPHAPARGARPKRLRARLADGREDALVPARPQVVGLWRAGDVRDNVSDILASITLARSLYCSLTAITSFPSVGECS